MHPKLANRLLAHSIDAATLSGSRGKGASWSGTLAFLAFMGVVIALLLWADRAFV
jgi:hypothetical protein